MTATRERVGIVGLGVMGLAVAGTLIRNGFDVIGFDIDRDVLGRFEDLGGHATASTGAVALQSDAVLLWLPTVESLDAVSQALARNARPGTVIAEMGTLPLEAKLQFKTVVEAARVEAVDAPVSGTSLQAADGSLVILASGGFESCEQLMPVFRAMAKRVFYLGAFGNGSRMKYIANLLVVEHTVAAAEAHVLGIAAGLDPQLVQEVISEGVGSSRIFQIRGPMMASNRYEPPSARLRTLEKDARVILDYAAGIGAPVPLLQAALPLYEGSVNAGLGDLDAAALCRYLEKSAGLRRPRDGENP